jgi:RimJ/RimL family protein N-acetyltransferase
MIVLETERLILRELAGRDAGFVVELLADPDFVANIGDRGVRTIEQAEQQFLRAAWRNYADHGFGLWLVETRGDTVPVGICGMLQRAWLDHPDLGYAFVPEGRGQGYALEAARGVIDWAAARAIAPVVAIVKPGNDRSLAILDRIGFVSRGTTMGPDGAGPPVLLLQKE